MFSIPPVSNWYFPGCKPGMKTYQHPPRCQRPMSGCQKTAGRFQLPKELESQAASIGTPPTLGRASRDEARSEEGKSLGSTNGD